MQCLFPAGLEKGREIKWNKKKIALPLFLTGVTLLGILVSLWCYRYDNKYTYPRPAAGKGVINLNMDWYEDEPFFYLVEGWEFYRGRTLSPGQMPDCSLYLGQYGGFDLGDPDADPHGTGIYRMEIVTDSKEREYALELTQIYSEWNLWINGRLMQSVRFDQTDADRGGAAKEDKFPAAGKEGTKNASEAWNPFDISADGERPEPAGSLVTFRAKDRIEIVAAVADESHFYSGMVYPPAFGSPERVEAVFSARLLIHGGVMAVAVAMAVLCLLLGLGCHFRRPYGAVAVLCLCVAGCTAWPVFQALRLTGDVWYLLERFCYYGIFLLIIWIQGRICRLPKRAVWPLCTVGIAVQISILIQPLVPVSRAASYMNYSHLLAAWKWLTAAWLLVTGIWSLCRKRQYAGPMMGGSCILAGFLVMGKLLPVYEPVYTGWFVEFAGLFILVLMAGILWYDTIHLYKESVELRSKQALAEIQLEARAEQAASQQEYVRNTRKLLHESRHRLTLIRHYLDTGDLGQLAAYLNGLTETMSHLNSREYTANTLIDALLTTHLIQADQAGIYVELELCNLPKTLPVADDDLTMILMNLLDNARESCCELSPEERWIHLQIDQTDDLLEIICTNAAAYGGKEAAAPAEGATGKADKTAHGFGLPHIREAASRYEGRVSISRSEDSFRVRVGLKYQT